MSLHKITAALVVCWLLLANAGPGATILAASEDAPSSPSDSVQPSDVISEDVAEPDPLADTTDESGEAATSSAGGSGPGDEAKKAEFSRYDAVVASLTVFVLAIFVGFEVITKVPPTLHTPLMSGSNAISGITIVGALLAAGAAFGFSSLVGMLAVVLAAINVVGGFLVTHRMLLMFQKKKKR